MFPALESQYFFKKRCESLASFSNFFQRFHEFKNTSRGYSRKMGKAWRFREANTDFTGQCFENFASLFRWVYETLLSFPSLWLIFATPCYWFVFRSFLSSIREIYCSTICKTCKTRNFLSTYRKRYVSIVAFSYQLIGSRYIKACIVWWNFHIKIAKGTFRSFIYVRSV